MVREMNRGMFSSKTEEWETPQKLFNQLDKEFHFNVDVCATRENTKCKVWFERGERSGLDFMWSGYKSCWMNPPYGRGINRWIKKAFLESKRGAVVVGLLPARTDTAWFHDYIYGKAEIRFLRGRIQFINKDKKLDNAPFPSMVVIWR